jgi:hypothetical protein
MNEAWTFQLFHTTRILQTDRAAIHLRVCRACGVQQEQDERSGCWVTVWQPEDRLCGEHQEPRRE